MSDLISRQAAIDALRTCYDTETISMDNGDEYINYGDAVAEIEQLSSAQPEVTEEEVKEYCRKRCLCIVDSALLKKYTSAQPEIVRCENCGWWQKEWPADNMGRHYCTMVDDHTDADFYCANAERREG